MPFTTVSIIAIVPFIQCHLYSAIYIYIVLICSCLLQRPIYIDASLQRAKQNGSPFRVARPSRVGRAGGLVPFFTMSFACRWWRIARNKIGRCKCRVVLHILSFFQVVSFSVPVCGEVCLRRVLLTLIAELCNAGVCVGVCSRA